MENTVINVNEVINATKGLAIIEAEYKKLYLGLSVRARRVLDFFHKQASNEMDFYKELLLLEKDQFQTINGCGRITANELLVFHHDFKINVGRSLLTKENDASISEEWPIFDNIDIDEACKDEASDELNSNLKLDRLISRLTSDLSIKSKYPARRFLKRFNGNWGELYKRITATRFSVYSIYGVGKVNGPEIRQWLERVKSVIQQHAITPQSKQSVSIASVSKGADSTTSDLDRLIGHKLESDDERRIKDMTDNLSKRSRTVVNRLIKQAGGKHWEFLPAFDR